MQCSVQFGFIRLILHSSGKVTLFQAYLHLDNNPMDSQSIIQEKDLKCVTNSYLLILTASPGTKQAGQVRACEHFITIPVRKPDQGDLKLDSVKTWSSRVLRNKKMMPESLVCLLNLGMEHCCLRTAC